MGSPLAACRCAASSALPGVGLGSSAVGRGGGKLVEAEEPPYPRPLRGPPGSARGSGAPCRPGSLCRHSGGEAGTSRRGGPSGGRGHTPCAHSSAVEAPGTTGMKCGPVVATSGARAARSVDDRRLPPAAGPCSPDLHGLEGGRPWRRTRESSRGSSKTHWLPLPAFAPCGSPRGQELNVRAACPGHELDRKAERLL